MSATLSQLNKTLSAIGYGCGNSLGKTIFWRSKQ
jgi:hypothetical protein